MDDQVEELAQTLKRLIGYGAHPLKLGSTTLLVELFVSGHATTRKIATLGRLVEAALKEAVRDLSGPHRIADRMIKADDLRFAVDELLGFPYGKKPPAADVRRVKALMRLKLGLNPTQFRKDGAELEIMRIVAQQMLAQRDAAYKPNFVIEEHYPVYSYDSRGMLIRIECRSKIRALVEGLSTFSMTREYVNDRRNGVLVPTAIFGCSLDGYSQPRPTSSLIRARFSFDPIPLGEFHEFSYAVDVNTDRSDDLYVGFQSRHQLTLYQPRLLFDDGRPPTVVWWFGPISSDLHVPDTFTKETRVPPERDGSYVHDFTKVDTGFFHGLAWRW